MSCKVPETWDPGRHCTLRDQSTIYLLATNIGRVLRTPRKVRPARFQREPHGVAEALLSFLGNPTPSRVNPQAHLNKVANVT